MLCQEATPAAKILSFNAAEVGVAAASAQTLTASFNVSGFPSGFTPTATLHYGHDYSLGAVTCTGGASETCTVTVAFQPSLPGARKDAIFLTDGTTRLATVLLGGVGQGPMSLLQPGAFSTSIPSSGVNTSGYNYIYQSVADENGTVYILPSGNAKFIFSVTKAGVASQIPLINPPYFAAIGIDGAGVIYLFNESNTATTYDTVLGLQGTYQIPAEPLSSDAFNEWYPGVIGVDGSIYVVDQIRNNGTAYALKPDGTTGYGVTLDPGVLQPYAATVDSAGNFFVGGYEINKITPAGVQAQVNTVGALEGLAVDAADTLYATRYSPTGGVAELPASNYSTAIASIDTSSSPLGMSLGSDGTVYVSNYVNLDIFDRSKTETINFGEVSAGTSSTLSTASVYNGGNQPLTISGFTLSGDGFSLDPTASNECASGTVLAPGALCQASVAFSPTHPGVYSGTISVTSNSLNDADTVQTIQLIGTTDGSYDVVSPNPLFFPSQAPGTSKTQAVTLTNEGSSYASTIYSVATDNLAFTIAQGTCAGVAVQPGASCQLQVTFSPAAAGAYTGTATIVTYVAGTAQASQTIALQLSGTGVSPVAAAPVIAPGTGTYTSSQQVTITDATPSATIYYTTDGSAPSTSSTKYTGAITVNSNETLYAIAAAAGYTQSSIASATYNFHEAVATVTPISLAFGNQVQGIPSAAQTVTLKNTGVGALTLTGLPITGSADFSQTNNCGGSLAAGSSCTLSIVYTPASLGSETATLTVNTDSIKAAPAVALTGTGIVPPPVLTLSSLAIAFGNQIINTSSVAQSVTVTNTSLTDTVTISTPQINAIGFQIQPSSCTAPLAPGASCAIPFVFAPAAVHAYIATVTFKAQAYGCGGCVRDYPVESVTLTGTGVVPPPPTITPASLIFGNQPIGSTSAPQTVTLTNPAAAGQSITLDEFFYAGSSGSFDESNNCPVTLAAGSSCQIQIVFAPKSVGAVSNLLVLEYVEAGVSHSASASLAGTGVVPPPPTITPASLVFGNQPIDTTSAPQTVTLTNPAAAGQPITLDGFFYEPTSGSFEESNDCPGKLAAGSSCQIQIVFVPKSVGAKSEALVLDYLEAGASYSASASLAGTGVVPPPPTITPASLVFGNQPVGSTSAPQTVTLTNPAAAGQPITLDGFFYEPTSGSFEESNNCPLKLAAGSSCQIQIVFTPKSVGAKSEALVLDYLEAGASYSASASLAGTGVVPMVSLTPASLSFSATAGTTSAAQTVTLSNTGKAPLTIGGIIAVSSPLAGLFNETSTCGASLAAGASCTILVTFSPVTTGSVTGSLLVTDNATGSPQSIALSGTGTAAPLPVASLFPASLSFTAVAGTTSAAQTVTLSNTGKAPLTISGIIAISSPLAGQFSETSTCGASLAAGASCTILVTFLPVTTGSVTGSLLVTDNATGSPQSIALSGFATLSVDTPLIDFGQGFASDALALNGPATITSGALQLTSGPSSAASSAFYPTPVPTKSFDTQFTFQLLDPTAEGITFTIQGDGPNAVGLGGGGLGYQGLHKSLAVKFDLKDTAGEGIDSTGIYVDGAAPTVPAVSLASSGIDLHSGHTFALHLSYDGTTMSVNLTDTVTNAVWSTQAAEDIPGITGGSTAYFGFTAGSGTPTLNSDAAEAKTALAVTPAAAAANAAPAQAASSILGWIYVANGETKTSQTISFPSLAAKTYGASPFALMATASSGLPVSYTVTGPAVFTGPTLTITGAGTVTVTASQPGNASFAPGTPVTQSFTVARAVLKATAASVSRVYGAANPALTYSISGFVNSDPSSVVSGSATLTTTATSTSFPGKYSITFATEGLAAANYNIDYVTGALMVTSTGTVAAPTFSPGGGTFNAAQAVALSAAPGATIYYSTNNSQPNAASKLYTSPIQVINSETIRAIAILNGVPSSIANATYVINPQSCQTIDYSNGFTRSSGLSLNAGATVTGNLLQLTDGGTFEARSAFYTTAVPIGNFTTDFTFQLLNPEADGMTFVIQSDSPQAVGLYGGGLGSTGLPHSIAFKFDLYSNTGEGFDSTGIYVDGVYPSSPATSLTPSSIDLHSGHIFAGHLTYANELTTGTITDTVTGASASVSLSGDLTQIVGNNAYVGFTGATGALTATQNVLRWHVSAGAGCGTD